MQSTPIAVEGWVGVLLVLVAGSPGRGLVFGESAGFGLVLSLVNHVASVDGVPVNDVGCSEAPRAFWPSPLSVGETALESMRTVRLTQAMATAENYTSRSPLESNDSAGPVP